MIHSVSRLSGPERSILAASLVAAAFLVVDPLVLQAVRGFDDDTRGIFRSFTDLGKSGWILLPLGAALLGLYLYRSREFRFRVLGGTGLAIQLLGFLFISVAGASLAASLIKNIIGRARPKLFDSVGAVEFQPFTFDYDFASFPSGHATTIFALAAALAVLWPRARIYLLVAAGWVAATRFLIGSHFFSDAIGGALLGGIFPYALANRMAARRWLFEKDGGGAIVMRGARLRSWLQASLRQKLLPASDTMAQID